MAVIRTRARADNGAVYSSYAAAGLVKALSARFPVARRLVGAESFDAALQAFIAAEPPASAELLNYGDGFPQFLRRFGRDACVNYVADIAELEAACGKARRAAGAVPTAVDIASMPGALLADLRLSFHPSVVLVQSRFPIVSVWQSNLAETDTALRQWRAEAALVARPLLNVEVWRLPPGGFEFLSELSRGATILQSAECAVSETPEFDLAVNLSLLGDANVVIASW